MLNVVKWSMVLYYNIKIRYFKLCVVTVKAYVNCNQSELGFMNSEDIYKGYQK